MVARYAPPISYNFLNLIHLGDNVKTTFEKVMVLISSFLFCCSVLTTWFFYRTCTRNLSRAWLTSCPIMQRMGTIDDIVPFFGRNFNRIYPLIMVVYTLLVASNFFELLIGFFGSLKRFKYWTDQEDDTDGFDPSGVFILQKGNIFLLFYPICQYSFVLLLCYSLLVISVFPSPHKCQ
jgi:hypothetical protein